MDNSIAKGVFDILPCDPSEEGKWREIHLWHYLETIIKELTQVWGYREIRTPLFEKSELFERSIGEGTDIVSKEMYTFFDKANRSLTLRPEGTASVMRALIEKKLLIDQPIQKLYYIGPMFRYERQQAGRYRQHHQFGAEAIGINSPYQDAELIALFYTFLHRLGLKDLTLHLNSLGTSQNRKVFSSALKAYLAPHLQLLSPESQERYETNPLRILDSKDPKDKQLLEKAPLLLDFLDEDEKQRLDDLIGLLKQMAIPFSINPKLVRGLDYYTGMVFEVTAKELGAQNSLGGGGRYDTLLKELGGPPLPAIGFGAGLERIIQTCLKQKTFLPPPSSPLLYLIPLGDVALNRCFLLLLSLRKQGLAVEMEMGGRKLGKAMKRADNLNARYVAVVGEEELKTERVHLKEMATGIARECPINSLESVLKNV